MFDHLQQLPPDPILGLLAAYREDTNRQKIDLGIGVYKDESGATPIMSAVKEAERRIIGSEDSKTYVGSAGDTLFNDLIQKLLFGEAHGAVTSERIATIQTTGGCGALRIAAEFLMRCHPDTRIWVSDPTWANHRPLLGDAGLEICEYPYYDLHSHKIKFQEMIETLQKVDAGEVVLLHGCCHNPCGADLTEAQWRILADLAASRGFIPFVDIAYQGLGEGLDDDAFGLRHLADSVPEMLVASSCSKNFGLYRERSGSVSVLVEKPSSLPAPASQLISVIRGVYSMPPHHGAAIVAGILSDAKLRSIWETELTAMRNRINQLRKLLVAKMADRSTNRDFSFIANERGMFSFLGLDPSQVAQLKEKYSIYMVDSSRINVAGISDSNIDYLCDSITSVLV